MTKFVWPQATEQEKNFSGAHTNEGMKITVGKAMNTGNGS